MNKKSLMLMANNRNGEKKLHDGAEYEDRVEKERYPMMEPYGDHLPRESKFRDRWGREHYDNDQFDPQNDYEEPWMDHRMPSTHDDRSKQKMNLIGFSINDSDASVPKYHETDVIPKTKISREYSESEYIPRFDRQMAEEWADNMENEDGTRGPHWTLEQAKQVMAQKEIGGSPWAFWVALNATYSDLCKMFKKYGINTVDAYVDFAKAFWLDDSDAVSDKLAMYYTYVVKH